MFPTPVILSFCVMLLSLNTCPSDWNYSVYVEPYLDIHYFEKKEKEVLPSKSKQKEKESNIIGPEECLNLLIDHTGLKYLRAYDSGKVLFLYFPYYKCHFKINESNLATIISRIFFELHIPSEFFLKNYLEDVAKLATYHSQISYLGKPENDIKKHLVSLGTKVWDLKKGILIEDASPKLFVVNYHHPSK